MNGIHGGKRRGAGRPKAVQPLVRCSFRFAEHTCERLDAIGLWLGLDRTATIEWLAQEYFLRKAREEAIDRARDERAAAKLGFPLAD